MAYSPLTEDGKKFIRHICIDNFTNKNGNTLLSGKNRYALPYTNPPLNKTWTCNIIHNGKAVTTGEDLADALIDWFNKYSEEYQMDANVIAAQAYIESNYIMWNYAGSSTASGINQFTMLTIFGIIVENTGNSKKMSPIETATIINGLTNNRIRNSYDVNSTKYQDAFTNRPLLHQNVIDNPEIMIKAQCRYMKIIANSSNSLASTSLFCYSRGLYMSDTYSKSIQNCDNDHPGKTDYKVEGLNYVLKVFGVLGDKNNGLESTAGKGYKPRGYYFGYDDKFQTTDPTKNLRLNSSEFPWSPYDANVAESDEFNLENEFSTNSPDIVVKELSKYPNYKFIYYPASNYYQLPTKKVQIVLHHTASGEGSGNDILYWEAQVAKTNTKVAVSFIVTRSGTILQLFSTNYWAYQLGITSQLLKEYGTAGITNKILNQQAIGIELDNWGGLVYSNGNWYPPVNESITIANTNAAPIPLSNVITYNAPDYPHGFHGFYGFEKYTDAQLASLRVLINAIKMGFPDINLNYMGDSMWGTYDTGANKWIADTIAYQDKSGIWTHVSFRPDKSDCQPQPELVTLLKTL